MEKESIAKARNSENVVTIQFQYLKKTVPQIMCSYMLEIIPCVLVGFVSNDPKINARMMSRAKKHRSGARHMASVFVRFFLLVV